MTPFARRRRTSPFALLVLRAASFAIVASLANTGLAWALSPVVREPVLPRDSGLSLSTHRIVPLELDGVGVGGATAAGSVGATLTTSHSQDVIVAFVAISGTSTSLSCSDSAALTWHQRTTLQPAGFPYLWEMYAISGAAVSSDLVTCTTSTGGNNMAMTAFGVSGANTVDPFDPYVTPIPETGQGTAPEVNVTNSGSDFIIGLFGAYGLNAETAGTGFTLIADEQQPPTAAAEYEIEPTVATTAVGISQPTTNYWAFIADALAQATIIGPPHIYDLIADPPSVALGSPTTFYTILSGGTQPLSVTYLGLPPGCTSSSTLTLECLPITAGVYAVYVNVTDAQSRSATGETNLSVLPATGPPAPQLGGVLADPASIVLGDSTTFYVIVSGGALPLTVAYFGLPRGCNSVSTLSLECVPLDKGNYSVTVKVTDAQGRSTTGQANLTVGATPSVTIPASTPAPIWTYLVGAALGVGLAGLIVGAVALAVGRRPKNPSSE